MKKTSPTVVLQAKMNDRATQRMLKDQRISVIVENFHGVVWQKQTKVFPCFVIFENPMDFPGKVVTRLFDGQQPMRLITVKDSLDEARAALPPDYLCVPRSKTDDPIIVETWM